MRAMAFCAYLDSAPSSTHPREAYGLASESGFEVNIPLDPDSTCAESLCWRSNSEGVAKDYQLTQHSGHHGMHLDKVLSSAEWVAMLGLISVGAQRIR